jgi:hypothetical protein
MTRTRVRGQGGSLVAGDLTRIDGGEVMNSPAPYRVHRHGSRPSRPLVRGNAGCRTTRPQERPARDSVRARPITSGSSPTPLPSFQPRLKP